MKTLFNIAILTALLAIIPSPCFAMMEIEFISKERAKELGIELRATANGPNEAWIELEFKPEKFNEYNCVYLDIQDGKKFLMGWTPLRDKRTSSGTVVVNLMANREFLEKVTLTIVTGHVMDYAGHELRVKDFVDLKNLSDTPKKRAPAKSDTKDESRSLPASPRN
jgi:hypothetical protein